MKRFIVIVCIVLLFFTISSSKEASKNQSTSPTLNQYIEEMVASITESETEEMLVKLLSFGNRSSTGSACKNACDWALDMFNEWGFDSVYLDDFSSSYGPNVVAIKKGTKAEQDSIFITGGHIDSKGPGADDNGSGTILCMLTAKAMSEYTFRNDARFVLFNAEENGLIGSNAYVSDHKNDKIKGVLIHDMCLWWQNGDTDWQIEAKSSNTWLAEEFEEIGEEYVNLALTVNGSSG